MASYFLHVKTFGRGQGSKVTKAAAYRAGERIRDERTSAVYDHTGRTDVAHAEIVLPSAYADRVDMEWALDRSRLWNAAEHAGRRCNSRLAREVLVHVPPEITPAQRTQLVRSFSRELADRYGGAVDFAVHVPRPRADPRHHHAHLLMTTRQVGPDGLGACPDRSRLVGN
jgi:ATP-dependent exoDNAse (exonuclease V) alpha subunit